MSASDGNQVSVVVNLSSDLKLAFSDACKRADTTMSQALRAAILAYVKAHPARLL